MAFEHRTMASLLIPYICDPSLARLAGGSTVTLYVPFPPVSLPSPDCVDLV
jgi:hypothetical protein